MYRIIESVCQRFGWERRTPEGKIYAKVRVSAGDEVKFRINAAYMEVSWGDGTESGLKKGTECFTHTYTIGGEYEVLVTGKGIVDLFMKESYLTELDVTECPTLEYIDCSRNELTELDLRNCRRLYELECGYNHLRSLELSKYQKLSYLSCPSNELRSIRLNGCRKLFQLICKYNHLTELDVSKCRKLVCVDIAKNDMTTEAIKRFLNTLAPCRFIDEGDLILGTPGVGDREVLRKKGWVEKSHLSFG